MKKSLLILFFIYFKLVCYGQDTVMLGGNSFEQRSKNLIDSLRIQPLPTNPLNNFPLIAARLFSTQDAAAVLQFNQILQMNLSPVQQYFTNYWSMHTYLLCKKNIPSSSVFILKNYYGTKNFSLTNYGSNNLFLFNHAAAFLACEQWDDFQDNTGRSREDILAFSRGKLLDFLTSNFEVGCYEYGARSYHVLNLLPIKMLIDFSKDKEIRQYAYRYYNQILFSMVGNYNNGIYIDTAPRNRYYHTMGDGHLNSKEINTLCWLLFGNSYANTIQFDNWYNPNNQLVFLTLPGYSIPDPRLNELYQSKTYPYIRIGSLQREINYNSQNYGLATHDRNNIQSTNSSFSADDLPIYLAWQSDLKECHFSVWQHNTINSISNNDFGRGRNPYSRFFQKDKTVISLWNVPITYTHFAIEAPFHQQAYKAKIISNGWVFCHTGSMMFAFTSINPQELLLNGRPGYDIIKVNERKGWYILETTELSSLYPGPDFTSQLNAYKDAILAVNRITITDFNLDNFTVTYLNTSNELLSATYYGLNQMYSNEYKINGQNVVYDNNYLLKDPYTTQELNSLEMTINFSSTNTAKIKLVEPFTNELVLAKNSANKYFFTSQMNTSPYRFWVVEDKFGQTTTIKDSINLVLNDSLQYLKNVKLFTENQIVDKEIFSTNVLNENSVFAANGYIRFNTTLCLFEGYSNGKWYPLGRHSNLLNQISAAPLMAYSLRKINENYTGPLVKIRRTDGLLIDIYPDNSGNLDSTSLLNFTGISDGFVHTWYDQSGNNRHSIQTSLNKQPKLVSNGVIFTFTGSSKPCMRPEVGKVLVVPSIIGQSHTFGSLITCYADVTTVNRTMPFYISPVLHHGQDYTSRSHLVGGSANNTKYRYGNHYTNNILWNSDSYTTSIAGRPLKCAITCLNPTATETMTVNGINLLNQDATCCNNRNVSAVWEIIIFSEILDSKTRNLIYTNQSNYYFE